MQVLYHKKVEKGTINGTNVNILNVKFIKNNICVEIKTELLYDFYLNKFIL